MLFNSIDFAVFLPIFFMLYWFVFGKNLQTQNLLVLVGSFIFYGWWDWRFLLLIVFSTLVDFVVGIEISKSTDERRRKILLVLSLCTNLGLLGFFKYFNFFIENFVQAFSFFGLKMEATSLNIILPVGISFYTFQTLSYTIDVYRGTLVPTKNIIAFAAFVSFFPQLVAGPIERAANLLPQFYAPRYFDYQKAIDGLRQILWGLFKKIVIADSCAEFANIIFNNSADYGGSTLVLGAIFFTFQIYGDFSGYSDIALGLSRLFGFDLMRNFAFPYFSRDVAEFWRRWHISLSTWFKDYLYIPLGGSKGGKWLQIRNTYIIFLVSGFWHGANWTFIVWGLLNALYMTPSLLLGNNRNNLHIVAPNRWFPSIKALFNISLTFVLVLFAWIFFRAENITHASQYIAGIFQPSLFSKPFIIEPATDMPILPLKILLFIVIFVLIEWVGREGQHALAHIGKIPTVLRWIIYYVLAMTILLYSGKTEQFIYFQF
jgi:alginate O-acetyltransferase complex protein AlgI